MGLRLAVDGLMGAELRSALRNFQRQRRLRVTGILGPETEEALKAACRGDRPPAQAEADLGAISDRLRDLYPDDNGNIASPRVLKLQDEIVGGYREGLWLILAAVVVVLLIACANLASFQLARAALRHKEMAIRTALGARRKIA